jgi:hypothetical protein
VQCSARFGECGVSSSESCVHMFKLCSSLGSRPSHACIILLDSLLAANYIVRYIFAADCAAAAKITEGTYTADGTSRQSRGTPCTYYLVHPCTRTGH